MATMPSLIDHYVFICYFNSVKPSPNCEAIDKCGKCQSVSFCTIIGHGYWTVSLPVLINNFHMSCQFSLQHPSFCQSCMKLSQKTNERFKKN